VTTQTSRSPSCQLTLWQQRLQQQQPTRHLEALLCQTEGQRAAQVQGRLTAQISSQGGWQLPVLALQQQLLLVPLLWQPVLLRWQAGWQGRIRLVTSSSSRTSSKATPQQQQQQQQQQ
jgi:hypothetical protein